MPERSGHGAPKVWLIGLVEQVEFFAGFKANCFAGGNADLGSGTGISAYAGLARLNVENAKTTQLNTITLTQSLLHCLENCVDGRFCFDTR
jgi:hypothetical protein